MITLLLSILFGSNVIYVENPVEYPVMTVTAYSEIDSCHYNCLMASGKKAYVGAIACPRNWELGVKVLIEGEIYTCEDRYNKNLSDRIDIFQGYGLEAYQLAKEFGVKKLVVKTKNPFRDF